MEVSMWLLGGALLSAFLGAYQVAQWDSIRRVVRCFRRKGSSDAALATPFVSGFRPVLPLSDSLLQLSGFNSFCSAFVELRAQQLKQAEKRACASVFVTAALVSAAGMSLLSGSLLSGIAATAAVSALVVAFVFNQQAKRTELLRAAIPETLQAMRACFQAGFSLEQTLEYLSKNEASGLSKTYEQAVTSLKMGCSSAEALEYLKTETHAPELVFVSVALDIQHQTGGSLSPILSVAEKSARDQFELEQSLSVQTAQARLSSRIVSVMPFMIVGVFSVISPSFFDPFFQSALGIGMLLVAITMEVAGVTLVHKMLQVRGVTE